MLKKLTNFAQPPEFASEEENKIARILMKIFYILPIYYIIVISTRLLVQDRQETIVLIVGYLMVAFAFLLLKKKKLRLAIFGTALAILAQVTVVATFSFGIRDLALFAFPGILILMSLLLEKKRFLILTLISLLCVAWISLGAKFGWYTVQRPPEPSIYDFIIASALVIITAYMAFLLADNSRQSLQRAREEIQRREALSLVVESNLREKEMLLKEIHHRVKNNLTVIYSLLNLQKTHIHNKQQAIDAFDDMRSRIISMSLVHEQLYQSKNFSQIAMKHYIHNMAEQLKFMYTPKKSIDIRLDVEDISLSMDNAIPCGMMINEITSNAFKHAFQQTEHPVILITLKQQSQEKIQLTVSDNGSGLPADLDLDNPKSMGLRLVHLLVEQLDAQVYITQENGTRFTITFPAAAPIKSI